jgi:predicted dehydrogenase
MQTNRRIFFQSAAAAALPRLMRGDANSRIRVAIVGMNGRGNALMKSLHRIRAENVEIAALCDVDTVVLTKRAAELDQLGGGKVKTYRDIRAILDDKSVDAVIHTTPTNWHALGAIWTMQAGKDAYVEKPLALTPWEGRKIVEAARKYNRIVQHGTQCRSSPEILEALDLLHRGAIGDVYMARGIGHKYRPGIGKAAPGQPPATLNSDMWRGPAPLIPYRSNRIHYNWHWFWDTGNGDLGNLAVHGLDVMRMALKLPPNPDEVQSMGGNLVWDDDKETPNFQTSIFKYGKRKLLEYSIRNGYSNSEAGMGETIPFTLGDKRDAHGLMVYGSEGYMVLPDYISYKVFLGRDRKPGPARTGTGPAESNEPHLSNFLKAMRSRRPSDLNAEAEIGMQSADLCHLANIAYRVGRTLRIDAESGSIRGDEEASNLRRRAFRAAYTVPENV